MEGGTTIDKIKDVGQTTITATVKSRSTIRQLVEQGQIIWLNVNWRWMEKVALIC